MQCKEHSLFYDHEKGIGREGTELSQFHKTKFKTLRISVEQVATVIVNFGNLKVNLKIKMKATEIAAILVTFLVIRSSLP